MEKSKSVHASRDTRSIARSNQRRSYTWRTCTWGYFDFPRRAIWYFCSAVTGAWYGCRLANCSSGKGTAKGNMVFWSYDV